MGWTRCTQSQFTQIASDNCLRCGARLPKPIAKTRRSTASTPTAETVLPARRVGTVAAVAGVILLAAAVGVTLWLRRAPAERQGPRGRGDDRAAVLVRCALSPRAPGLARNLGDGGMGTRWAADLRFG